MLKLNQALANDHAAANAIRDVRAQLAGIQQRFAGRPENPALVQAAALDAKLGPLLQTFYQYRAHAEEAMLNYPSELNSQLAYLELGVDSADSAPTAQQQSMYTTLRAQLDAALAQWTALRDGEITRFNERMQQAGFGAVNAARSSP